jgi:hypothetical protein
MMKPYAEWQNSKMTLGEYLHVEDLVDGEFVDYFLSNNPIIQKGHLIQMGEPCDVFAGEPTFDTLYREDELSPWMYAGECFVGEMINRNVRKAKRIYVCSRYRADTEEEVRFNVEVAKYFSKNIANDGAIPVTPHIYFPQFLDDGNEIEREFGLEVGMQMIDTCQTYVVVIIDGKISEGMKREIEYMTKTRMMRGQQVRISRQAMEEMMKAVR